MAGGLDILTEKGQRSVAQVGEAVRIWNAHFPAIQYVRTNEASPADIDAIMVKTGVVEAIVETKCRDNLTLDTFRSTFRSEWLVTYDKIERGVVAAKAMAVPFVGFLYLVTEKALLFQTIWRPKTGYCIPFRVHKTETQATTNGGLALRDNAYLDMSTARVLRMKTAEAATEAVSEGAY